MQFTNCPSTLLQLMHMRKSWNENQNVSLTVFSTFWSFNLKCRSLLISLVINLTIRKTSRVFPCEGGWCTARVYREDSRVGLTEVYYKSITLIVIWTNIRSEKRVGLTFRNKKFLDIQIRLYWIFSNLKLTFFLNQRIKKIDKWKKWKSFVVEAILEITAWKQAAYGNSEKRLR